MVSPTIGQCMRAAKVSGMSNRLKTVTCVSALLFSTLATAQSTLQRVSEFEYHPTTGLLTLERVDPGGSHCVETVYSHDEYGNRQRTEVRPCANVRNTPSDFAPRVVAHRFAAGAQHPAGVYATHTKRGDVSLTAEAWDAGGENVEEAEATFDARFGAASTATEVGRFRTVLITKRIEYDTLGRARREVVPTRSALDGAYAEAESLTRYVQCQNAEAGCLLHANFQSFERVPVDYPSVHSQDLSTQVRIHTAYYVETTPMQAGQKVGATQRTHFDALGREIAKESESPNKNQWIQTLTVRDTVGKVAATYGPYFTSATLGEKEQTRQWTSRRDLLHRPVQSVQRWQASSTASPTDVTTTVEYNGLSTTTYTPYGINPSSGATRSNTVIKDVAGQVQQIVDAYGATLNFDYDAYGNLTRTTNALGHSVNIAYTPGTARFKQSMSDPDKGQWSYSYDAVGQLKSQTDGRGVTTQMAYDVLGRAVSKASAGGTDIAGYTAQWRYSRDRDGNWCARGLSRVCDSWTDGSIAVNTSRRVSQYDGLGRPIALAEDLDRRYQTLYTFDDVGRPAQVIYPTGLRVSKVYATGADANQTAGAVTSINQSNPDGSTQRSLWSIQSIDRAFDAHGNVLAAQLGNGVRLQNVTDVRSGKPFQLTAGVGGPAEHVSDITYQYDVAGNITGRMTSIPNAVDAFQYDLLDRLTHQTARGRAVDVQYNAIGNILFKTDVGGYSYTTGRPHAVATAGGSSYNYDGNGNVVSTTGAQQRDHTWTSFNQPARMTYASSATTRTVQFNYDDQHRRVREVVTVSNGPGRILYLMHPDNAGGLGFEREETWSGAPNASAMTRNENRHYIQVPGSTVVIKTVNDNSSAAALNPNLGSDANDLVYWHKDSLGSIVSVHNNVGAVVERPAFDAWGRKVREDGSMDNRWAPSQHADRGYTGHEQLDEIGLVHMNGRVYDALLGRFLSPDPVNAIPHQMQNYNAYSYVLNNPMRYTDPSGQCVEVVTCVAIFVVGFALAQSGNEYWRMVGTFVMMYAGNAIAVEAGLGTALTPAGLSAQAAATSASVVNGAVSAGVATALTRGSSGMDIATAVLFSTAFFGAGEISNEGLKLAAHTALGCVQGAVSGGQCGPSALAAYAGKGMTMGLGPDVNPVLRGAITIVAGGTASVMGGGKFASGAGQAAFGFLFNECRHTGMCGSSSTTSVQATVNPAGGLAGVIWTDPTSLHFGFVINDGYGSQRIDGQPSCFVCFGSPKLVAEFGSTAPRRVLESYDLQSSSRQTLGDLAVALRSNALMLSGSVPYSYPTFYFGTMGPSQYNSNSFANSIMYYSSGSMLGVARGVTYLAPGMQTIIPRP